MEFLTQSGMPVGRIGQGTWYLGEKPSAFARECRALRAGIDAGMNLIDTAEMYGEGAAERLVGDAIQGVERGELYLVSKVYPFHAGRRDIFRCCENSLRRMKTDYLDLYLLHWRGSVPFAETAECMEQLKERGLIRAWGVSNLDLEDMEELFSVDSGQNCQTDQVLYHLGSRGIEYDLLPWLREHGLPIMAYCPLAQAGQLRNGLLRSSAVRNVAEQHGASACQILLAFLLAQEGIVPIPCSSRPEHTLENAAAVRLQLSAEELQTLNHAFPAPNHKTMLDIV